MLSTKLCILNLNMLDSTCGVNLVGGAAKRKSNCVKEVERIKQQRDARRAAQQAIREQFETEYDTSDPNWEFIRMIK